MATEAIILAGGLGTRLRSAVPDLPKALAPVAGRPFLSYVLQFLEGAGVRRVVLAVGYRSEAIQSTFGGRYGDLQLVYSIEDEPLGTGGALMRALTHIRDRYALVLNGDTFLQIDYQGMARVLEEVPDGRMAVALRRVEDATRYGVALVSEGRIVGFASRGKSGGGLINAGSYVVHRQLFEDYPMPVKFSLEQDFLQGRVGELRPVAFECEGAFIDIGIPEAFEQAGALLPAWMPEVARTRNNKA